MSLHDFACATAEIGRLPKAAGYAPPAALSAKNGFPQATRTRHNEVGEAPVPCSCNREPLRRERNFRLEFGSSQARSAPVQTRLAKLTSVGLLINQRMTVTHSESEVRPRALLKCGSDRAHNERRSAGAGSLSDAELGKQKGIAPIGFANPVVTAARSSMASVHVDKENERVLIGLESTQFCHVF